MIPGLWKQSEFRIGREDSTDPEISYYSSFPQTVTACRVVKDVNSR